MKKAKITSEGEFSQPSSMHYSLDGILTKSKLNEIKLLLKSTRLDVICISKSYNHGQKSWDTFAFLGCFPIHTGRTPPLTPQTMLDACIQNFFWVSTCIGWGEGELQENFENDALF